MIIHRKNLSIGKEEKNKKVTKLLFEKIIKSVSLFG
jgi:hypothetical protein